MKVSYKTINDNMFMSALETLSNQVLPGKVSYAVSKIHRAVKNIVKDVQPEFRKIMEEVADKDEQGNWIPQPEGRGLKIKADCAQRYEQLMGEFLAKEAEIPWGKIFIDDLVRHAQLAPSQLEALEPILTDVQIHQQ